MNILGIETTCDETSFAIVKDGKKIVSQLIASQEKIHLPFGGVVPELACRHHIDALTPLLSETLKRANLKMDDIDAIAVANGPGLIGALLIGIHFAKGLAWSLKKPLIGVNHIEAHLYAAMMSQKKPLLPALGMVISGGHTSLIVIEDIGRYSLLGETVDDAVGEAFDKVAKMLDLPYPGGPHVEKLALQGNPQAYSLKSGRVKEKPLHFSLSGLKTAVLYAIRAKKEPLTDQEKADIAASFQYTVFQDILEKINIAIKQQPETKAIFLGGGVTQNKTLRTTLEGSLKIPIFWPEKELCLDNAAMIAGLGFHKWKQDPSDKLLELEPATNIPF